MSSYRGGSLIKIYGIGLFAVNDVQVSGRRISFSSPVLRDASYSASVASALQSLQLIDPTISTIQEVSFFTPALVRINQNATAGSANASAIGMQAAAMGASQRRLLQSNGEILADPSTLNLTDATTLVNPISAYQVLSMRAILPGSSSAMQLNFTNLIFYSSSTCIAPGVWRDDGAGGCFAW